MTQEIRAALDAVKAIEAQANVRVPAMREAARIQRRSHVILSADKGAAHVTVGAPVGSGRWAIRIDEHGDGANDTAVSLPEESWKRLRHFIVAGMAPDRDGPTLDDNGYLDVPTLLVELDHLRTLLSVVRESEPDLAAAIVKADRVVEDSLRRVIVAEAEAERLRTALEDLRDYVHVPAEKVAAKIDQILSDSVQHTCVGPTFAAWTEKAHLAGLRPAECLHLSHGPSSPTRL